MIKHILTACHHNFFEFASFFYTELYGKGISDLFLIHKMFTFRKRTQSVGVFPLLSAASAPSFHSPKPFAQENHAPFFFLSYVVEMSFS